MTDIVQELRRAWDIPEYRRDLVLKAADEIERLRALVVEERQ